MHFYSLQGAAGPLLVVAGLFERVVGYFGRAWRGFFERVAGKILIYSQMSTSFPPPEPGEDTRHFIDYQTVGHHANKCEKPRTTSSLLLFRVEKPNFVTG